jgi:hypothetical protein
MAPAGAIIRVPVKKNPRVFTTPVGSTLIGGDNDLIDAVRGAGNMEAPSIEPGDCHEPS